MVVYTKAPDFTLRRKAKDEFTVMEAAAHAKVHHQTIRNWIKVGLLPAEKGYGSGGKTWFIKQDVLEAVLRGE